MSNTELLATIAGDGTEAVVTFDRSYATTPDDLWDAVTTPERLERWFAPVRGDLTPGGSFVIHFDDRDTPECRLETCDAPHSFTWTWPHEAAASHVAVEVTAEGDGSRLRLVHSRLASDKAPEYGAGWQAYVRGLDAHLAGAEVPGDDAWWAEFNAARDGYAGALADG